MSFDEYVAHGWRLCVIPPGGKGPREDGWNQPGTPQPMIPPGAGAGLMHVESGTCAIDIDQMEVATSWLAQRHIDLASLLNAPSAVRITSGRTGRAKLLYALKTPLTSKKTAPFEALSAKTQKPEKYTALDFRCATKGGLSLQDVLPGTTHPDTGKPYEWQYADPLCGSWRNLPELPTELRAVWEAELTKTPDSGPAGPLGAGFDEIRTLIAQQDPNADYNDWLRVGMAIHHETKGSQEGLHLWNEWSAQADGPDKYKGIADLEPHWRSFDSSAAGAVTLGSLRAEAVAEVSDFALVLPSTTPAKPTGEFQVIDGADLENAPPLEWIVEKLIPDAAVGAIYGPSGAGKSSWVLDLVIRIAAGLQWRELIVKQRRVLYIVGEGVGGMRGETGRFSRTRRKLGLQSDIPIHFITNKTPNLVDKTDPPKLAEIVRSCRETPVGLVIFDTLAQTTPGADENSGKDMGVALEHCKLIHQATGAMVLLIAHAGKDEARGIRGWSGIKGALDVEIEVTERAEEIRVARVSKMRDGADGAEFPFRLEAGVVEHTDELPKSKAPRRTGGAAIVHFHTVCTERLGIGAGHETDVDEVLDEVMARMAVAPGDQEKTRKDYRRQINNFCAASDAPFKLHNNMVRQRDAVDFTLQLPVGQAGIDAEPAKAHAHSDLLGM